LKIYTDFKNLLDLTNIENKKSVMQLKMENNIGDIGTIWRLEAIDNYFYGDKIYNGD
jgi:hypothetical protein